MLQVEATELQCMRIKMPLLHSQGDSVPSSIPLCNRNVVISWTDAASTTKFLSAVFFDGEKFEYTRMVAPAQILGSMTQRNDGMIGVLELLAVLLVLETWKEKLSGTPDGRHTLTTTAFCIPSSTHHARRLTSTSASASFGKALETLAFFDHRPYRLQGGKQGEHRRRWLQDRRQR